MSKTPFSPEWVFKALKPPAITAVLGYFFLPEMLRLRKREWWRCIPATSASQNSCCQTLLIQESKTEGDSSTAKYSVPPVCLFLFLLLSPPLPAHPLPLPSRHARVISTCLLMRGWQHERRNDSAEYASHSRAPAQTKGEMGERRSL